MSDPVSIGFLSTAKINDLLLEAASESQRVDVVAVASRDAARAEEYARAQGLDRAYGSYEALLEAGDVEAVYVPLPNSLHIEWSIRALEAGKHVLCEKPLSRRPDDVARAFDVAARRRKVLMEAFMYRHHPQTLLVKQLVDRGSIGRLRALRAAFSFDLLGRSGPEDIRLSPELDGGALMDIGCYCVNGLRMLAGEPERVFGEQLVGENGVDMAFHGTLRFPGEVVGQFHVSFALPLRQELEAFGDRGSLLVEAPWRVDYGGAVVLRDGSDIQRAAPVEEANAYRCQLDNFAAAIRGEAPPLLGREDAAGQVAAIDALYRSADAGKAVAV